MSAASKTKKYDVVPTSVRRMTRLYTPDGDIKFTSLMKLVYAYIWTFQENKERGNDDPIHTNTNVIAWEMGVSEKAVIDALKALDAAQVVIKQTVKVRGNVNSSNYVAIPPASVVVLGVTPPKPSNGKPKQKSEGKHDDGKSEMQTATADQSPDLASEPATPAVVESDPERSDDDRAAGNHAVKQPKIFDDRGVITEAFVNSLTGNAAPYRNANGTLQSFQYVYWAARHTQDERDGVTVRTREAYMAEAQPWHIPPHLLSTPTPSPEYEEDPNF
ncbi:hypothetical protein [Erwinia persicina]|uniref:hypothetical protein n=1 Tax=Erwinia persicina TaxID=55211 RepID=UPI00177DCEC9|nr:hypothetical protein [Erwinia persicina]MBD8167430.1 hypothetical protein [Erwinia persicina]